MKFKKSFTLSEIMIAMAIFGIIATACIPIVLNMTPSRNAIMLKKAYYTTEQIVSDLINDQTYYPNGDFAIDASAEINDENPTITNPTSFAKFSCLFAKKMNIASDSHNTTTLETLCTRSYDTGSYNTGNANYIIVTNDGMIWNFVLCNGDNSFQLNDEDSFCRIDVSVPTSDITTTGYDTSDCLTYSNGWGTNICGQTRVNKIGKAAFAILHDGSISLDEMLEGDQNNIKNIINGTTSLLGK